MIYDMENRADMRILMALFHVDYLPNGYSKHC